MAVAPNETRSTLRALAAAALLALVAGPLSAASASAAAPDRPGHTSEAVSKSGSATSAVSGSALRRGLLRQLRYGGGAGGTWVQDLSSGKSLFKRSDRHALIIASNMKLFTTATALGRLGPKTRLPTELWAAGELDGSVVRGDLILRGGGDPLLDGKGVAKLGAKLVSSGVKRITGRLLYDDSVFDRKPYPPQQGITGGPYLGRLSGLSFLKGAPRQPARSAARALISNLRKRGVKLREGTEARATKPGLPNRELLNQVRSATIRELIAATNVPSDNFLAEMLIKAIGAGVSGRGTTAAGGKLVAAFARKRGADVSALNGSGLSRGVRASPRSIGRLLASMQADEKLSGPYLDSLAVAGRTGTLYDRMRGTAAEGNCRGKTGTLTGDSALSGYCMVGGRVLAFSILMNGVDIDRAHVAQDRMAALIARYRP
ncbi:MAG: hypothetical protein EXQ70_04055 [Solirubrobacterales bacterium]|nr:hypothetical protein [Solirubrobacterales bacterium]